MFHAIILTFIIIAVSVTVFIIISTTAYESSGLEARKPNIKDFHELYGILVDEAKRDLKSIPHWARSSFHDLNNYDPELKQGGPHGCMFESIGQNMVQNQQLNEHTKRLKQLINEKMPKVMFSAGDLISFAGKVAIEMAYCVNINWRPGRPGCEPEIESGPSPAIQTVQDLQPFLTRYSFSKLEMAILTAGAHGLKEASLMISPTADKPWINRNSGLQWIKDTFNSAWVVVNNYEFQTLAINHIFETAQIIRLASDMMFFPSTIKKVIAKGNVAKNATVLFDEGFRDTEMYLEEFLKDSEESFNTKFANIYSKMLEIGVDPKKMGPWFKNENNIACM